MSCWCLVLFLKKECKIIRNVAGSQFENRQLVIFSHTFASFSSTCGGCWADLSSQMAQPAELPQDTSMGPSVVKNMCPSSQSWMPGSQLLQAKNRQMGGARAALVPAPSTSLRIGINHGQIGTWTCWWVWLMGGHGQELEPCPTMALLRLAWSPGSHFSSFFFFFNTLNPSWSLSLSEASKSCVSWKQIKLFITVTGGFFPAFVWTEEMMLPFRHSDRAAIQEVKFICHDGDFILSVLKCPPLLRSSCWEQKCATVDFWKQCLLVFGVG